ncbi:hypothetical protein A2567_02310 [Candidatus Azambacteria bacterium RIFOXYD1_FULL_42_11]|uniref:Uncharacterized protein n=4 Tax=Candidatus Azamiibacteriota TaxID=1752741 RepID=A0A0G0ZBW1_9BACT|nr:MAG: hypothetical protein UV07_C0002G0016 [Candidatus Azambacteria bacterium GW2011_GWB1_42_17]KKS46210.1 MAG: hypothetical protein UV10_C0006G0018 [Candidatus Azambacteria bacterium GW2011_GWA1_42_19]KKS75589.1 MAG: hypothetical protein UV48_C0009G0022 [Candidatus Azambacteria bacterium GW2011_GWA2_42_9]KKS88803.1 MAG: hypothetical protein UV62_C0002G0051 [Parcubacteria group bacterium GW2011_GWC1_43_11]OGD43248.1 MAG: hypothetical protein A2567_02310 [Candidatus Azambacteria bacterium RIFO
MRIIKNDKETGITLLFTMIILAFVLLTAVLIVDIVIVQLKLSGDINDSLVAIYAADSGVEWQLYQIRKGQSIPSPIFVNGAAVETTVTGSAPNFTIKSLGSFKEVKRQFEVGF